MKVSPKIFSIILIVLFFAFASTVYVADSTYTTNKELPSIINSLKSVLSTLSTLVKSFYATSVAVADTTSGLVAHWKLDEGSGTTASDASGGGNTGTLVNGPVWTSGKVVSALSFDGVNDKVSVTSGSSLIISPL